MLQKIAETIWAVKPLLMLQRNQATALIPGKLGWSGAQRTGREQCELRWQVSSPALTRPGGGIVLQAPLGELGEGG